MTRKCPFVGFGDIFAFCSKIFVPYLYLLPSVTRFHVFYLTTLSVAGFIWPQCRFWWPYDLRRWSAAAHLLALRVRITPGSWMPVSCEYSVLSDRDLCVGIITRPDESYRLWYFCDRDAFAMMRPWPTRGCNAEKKCAFRSRWTNKRTNQPANEWMNE